MSCRLLPRGAYRLLNVGVSTVQHHFLCEQVTNERSRLGTILYAFEPSAGPRPDLFTKKAIDDTSGGTFLAMFILPCPPNIGSFTNWGERRAVAVREEYSARFEQHEMAQTNPASMPRTRKRRNRSDGAYHQKTSEQKQDKIT